MPKRSLSLSVDDYYHVYNRAVANNQLFKEERNYWFFISKIKFYLLKTAEVLAYCLMPNHYHLVIKLKTLDLPTSMQRIAMSYTAAFNKVYQRSGHLFQGRYQLRFIADQKYLEQSVRYIHLNPCRAGLVNKPGEWEMSSYLEYTGERRVDFINNKIILDLYGSGNDPFFIENQLNYKKIVEGLISG